ncbi:hypothetical protein BDF14DRAFT_1773234 [Spinellus fusiger]|nr:hypothetical protein BDF14DRAFT_1773234 [Spinellus fusiger]
MIGTLSLSLSSHHLSDSHKSNLKRQTDRPTDRGFLDNKTLTSRIFDACNNMSIIDSQGFCRRSASKFDEIS